MVKFLVRVEDAMGEAVRRAAGEAGQALNTWWVRAAEGALRRGGPASVEELTVMGVSAESHVSRPSARAAAPSISRARLKAEAEAKTAPEGEPGTRPGYYRPYAQR